MTNIFKLFFILIIFIFQGCQQQTIEKKPNISKANLKKIRWENIEGFFKDDLNLALEVFQKDCKARKINKNLKNVCKKSFKAKDGKNFFTKNFTPYRLLNKKNNPIGLITGYYEPILHGSFKKTSVFKYPILKLPKDLITVRLSSIYPTLRKYTLRGKLSKQTLIPYPTRQEIENQKSNKNLIPLLYVDDKIDRFFLEIQGSGKVMLPNKQIINIAYAGQNGRKYYPIGAKLLKDKLIKKENLSLQTIRKWCEANPKKVDNLLNLNKSKVFFKISKKSATGSLGVTLVAKRNLAVDTKFIPLGFAVFLNTTNPTDGKKINSLMVSADTGGAIKGDIRADYFWGSGANAKLNAGKMANKGQLTILIPNQKIQKWSNDTSYFIKVKDNP
jgi:membrane-bound lytic murein transglycosylase A